MPTSARFPQAIRRGGAKLPGMPFDYTPPKYAQVVEEIRQRIERGDYPPGTLLPSEHQLVIEFGVSRPTIVKALTVLRQEGSIATQQGRGSVALARAHEMTVRLPDDMWERLRAYEAAGGRPAAEVLVELLRAFLVECERAARGYAKDPSATSP